MPGKGRDMPPSRILPVPLGREAGSHGGGRADGMGCRQAPTGACLPTRSCAEHSPSGVGDSEDSENPEDRFPKEKDEKPVA